MKKPRKKKKRITARWVNGHTGTYLVTSNHRRKRDWSWQPPKKDTKQ